MEKKVLPLGSIVYLEEGTVKLMIIGRGATFDNGDGETFSDYVGVMYPTGVDPTDAIFFNHKDIDKIVFTGYTDEEEERYMKVYEEWIEKQEEEREKKYLDEHTVGF